MDDNQNSNVTFACQINVEKIKCQIFVDGGSICQHNKIAYKNEFSIKLIWIYKFRLQKDFKIIKIKKYF
jgi:hypothetical protein